MPTSLQGRLSLLFVSFVLLVLISISAMMWGLETQRQDALVINLAGRQRMLAQQMARLAFEAGAGQDVTNASLREAEQTFDQTLRALLDGGTTPYLSDTTVTLPITRDPRIRTALEEVTRAWNDLRTLLDELQDTRRDDPSFDPTLQSIEQESSILVAQADEVVRLYEADAAAKLNRLRIIQVGFLIAALILLGMGAYITRRYTLDPLRALARAAKRLGENDLDSAVQVEGPEEMRRLSEAFDSMRQSLRSSRAELLELMSTLEERVAQRTRELDALNEVSREIASQLDSRYVLNSVTDKARKLLDGESAMLCLLGEDRRYLHLQAVSGPPLIPARQEYMSTINEAGAVLASPRALICGHAQCVGGCGLLADAHVASHAVAPLRVGEKVIGALCVSSSQAGHFTNESADVLTKLANTAAIALQNAQLYAQAERAATLEERQRVAAEMHDGLGQTLSYLGLMTDQTMELLSQRHAEAALELLHTTRETIEKATVEVRRAITRLIDETSLETDLCARLKTSVDEFAEHSGLRVAWQAEAAPGCSRQAAEQVLNIAAEALKNVARHAEAKQAMVRVGESDGRYFVAIEDDGKGFDVSQPEPSGHFGLKVMQARAAHIGGQVEIKSEPGGGTRVTLRWRKDPGV